MRTKLHFFSFLIECFDHIMDDRYIIEKLSDGKIAEGDQSSVKIEKLFRSIALA